MKDRCHYYNYTVSISNNIKCKNMYLKKPTYAWYAIYTKVNMEKKIYNILLDQKIDCYLPLIKTLRQWSDRKKWIESPLFKSYIFVKVSYVEYFDVLNIPGVFNYVSFGGKAQAIPEEQLENIKILIAQKEREVILTKENLSKGDKAEVIIGALKGLTGEVTQICGQSRIVIKIDSLNCSLYAKIAMDEVRITNQKEDQTGNRNPKELPGKKMNHQRHKTIAV